MSDTWPKSLKDWVTQCLTQMTEANKTDAQTELKEVIREAFSDGSMWTRDWSKAKLKSLEPKTFKRKTTDPTPVPVTKKAKKSALASTLSSENDERLLQRARRFEREHEIERQKQAGLHPTHEHSRHVNHAAGGALEDRMEGLTPFSSYVSRGAKGQSRRKYLNAMGSDETGTDQGNVLDWDRFTIVGTSESMFKNYLRLTSEPDPRDIRPYRILTQTLEELTRRWKGNRGANYDWFCDQFKSLRQDLTVQRIKNEFTVRVYEIHARMALEAEDLVEFNQCQSALRTLYELGIPGKREEFLAYRILYLLHVRNRSDLNRLIATLTPQVKAQPAVKHALDVQRAMATSNYHALFALYADTPNMGAYIMDHTVLRERLQALCVMSKAYHTLPLTFVSQELGFPSISEAHKFLVKHNAAVYSVPKGGIPMAQGSTGSAEELSSKNLDCKATHATLMQAYEANTRRVAIRGAI